MIELRKKSYSELKKSLESNSSEVDIEGVLSQKYLNSLNNLFFNKEFISVRERINSFDPNKIFSKDQIYEIKDSLELIQDKFADIVDDMKMEDFFKDGYALNINDFKAKFKNKGLRKKFPHFNFERLNELYAKPPDQLQTNYNDEFIKIDTYIFRKYLTGMIQMVLDEMDFVSVIVGGEGVGKSTHVTQLMYQVYWMLKEIGVIEYDFDIKEIFFNTLEKFRRTEDKYFDTKFRILALDEGNELHRQNWRDEEVQTFFHRLRRERFNQRIKFICIPQVGELNTSIVLDRANFITELVSTNDLKTGSLIKGKCHFYIVPRGEKVYSPSQKTDLTRGQVKTMLLESLKDKNYLKGLPKECMVKTYRCNGVWAWRRELYIKELKETNKIFTIAGGYKMSDWEAFCWDQARISFKAQGISSKDAIYSTLNKSYNRLKKKFEDNMDLYNQMVLRKERKVAEKEIKLQVKELREG